MKLKEIVTQANKELNETLTQAKFISKLFESRTQAHIYHLQTSSYAAHKALDDYYSNIVDLVDSLVEEQQGKTGIIKGYEINKFDEGTDYISYFSNLRSMINLNRYKTFKQEDTNIQNTIDEIVSLLDSTIYKLKFLK